MPAGRENTGYLAWYRDTPPSLRADPPGWAVLKKYLDDGTIGYLESIKPANLSGKSLSASISRGGRVKLATGWLFIEESESWLEFLFEPAPRYTQ